MRGAAPLSGTMGAGFFGALDSELPYKVIEQLARCFYPASLERFNNEEDHSTFAPWQAEQARCWQKKSRTFPTENVLTSKHSFFQVGCVLRGAPFFVFQPRGTNQAILALRRIRTISNPPTPFPVRLPKKSSRRK